MSEPTDDAQSPSSRRRRRRRGGARRGAGEGVKPRISRPDGSKPVAGGPAPSRAPAAVRERGRSAGPAAPPPSSTGLVGAAAHAGRHPAPPSAHELADAENQARVRANARRAAVLVGTCAAGPAVVAGVVSGVVTGPPLGAGIAAAVYVLVAAWIVVRAVPIALALIGASEIARESLPGLTSQLEELCATIGVAMPEVWVLDDPVANSCAVAGRGRFALVVTRGLLDRLGLIELEGVLAHELVHMKRGDAGVSALALATAGVLAWWTGHDGVVHAAVGKGREYEADQAAVLAVRYPPGLRDALAAMSQGPPVAVASGSRPAVAGAFSGRRWAATRWIWVDPMVGSDEPAPIGNLDATAVRREALAEW